MGIMDADVAMVMQEIEDGIQAGLNNAIELARDTLCLMIKYEVYTYNSEVYPRSNTLLSAAINAPVNVGGHSATLIFMPNGANSGTWGQMPADLRRKYGKKPTDPIKPNPVSGNALIRRIEQGTYDYKAKVGPRPFFRHTVEDFVGHRGALVAFIMGYQSVQNLTEIRDMGDVEITYDAGDWVE